MIEIPSKFTIGGQDLNVKFVPSIDGGAVGQCNLIGGVIKLATNFGESEIPVTVLFNTFWHETVHAILDTMGETELTTNERFVSCFAGFLCEAFRSMEYDNYDETKTT
jgi:hypothetical protein